MYLEVRAFAALFFISWLLYVFREWARGTVRQRRCAAHQSGPFGGAEGFGHVKELVITDVYAKG